MAKLTKLAKSPGIYRRHVKDCPNSDNSGRCTCNYAVPKRHRGKQVMETYESFEEARAAKGRKDTGDTKPKSKTTFGEYFTTWIDSYAGRTKRGFEDETRTEYRRTITDNALPLWEDRLMVDIGPGDVRGLYASMKVAGKSVAAMKKAKGALSPLFNTAIEDEIVPTNPVSGVKLPAPAKTATDLADEEDDEHGKALTREELARFLNAVQLRTGQRKRRQSEREEEGGMDWVFFFGFMVVTGMRIGEVIGLTWENVIIGGEKPRIRVREQVYEGRRKRYLKSDAGKREIPLSDTWAKRLLEHRRDHYKGPKTPVFASLTGAELRPSNVYRRHLAPAAIDAGLYVEVEGDDGELRKKTAIAFHAFRHTAASLLFDDGRNIKVISKWLGHTDPAFTLRVYIHLLDDGIGEGIDLPTVDPDAASGVHRVDLGVDLSENPAG